MGKLKTEENGRGRFRHLLRSLRSRNYRLFVFGQGISLIGTWMQQVAMSWLVYRLTGSALLLGVVGFAGHIPVFLLASIAGVLADRWDRRRLLLITQTLAMFQAALLAAIVYAGVAQVWQIILMSLALGVVSAFDIPIRQSFVVDMVENREDLGNAIALNSSLVHSARLIGPSIAGLLVAATGEAFCFALNSASYLGVIFALAAMRVAPRSQQPSRRHIFHEMKEGFRYAFEFTPIRNILLLVAIVSLLGISYTALLPVFAREIHHGGARTYGFLMGAAGGGALVGTLFLACRGSVLGLGRIMAWAPALLGCGIAVFALSESFPLSMISLMVAGFGAMTLVSSSNTILQTIVDEDKRGRVMSLYTMSFMGMSPFGSLLAGSLAGSIGARNTVLLGALSCIAGSVFFTRQLPAIREKVRPIYERMGIIGNQAVGTESSEVRAPVAEGLTIKTAREEG